MPGPDPDPLLTEGPVARRLAGLALPMAGGILAMMGFYLADTWFVSRLGAGALAAMGFAFPVVAVLLSLGIGLMAGTSSVIARAIGAGDRQRVRRLTSDALALALILAVALSAAGLATIEPLFTALGAEPALLPAIGAYMRIWYAGLVFLLVPMVGLGALRATGDSRLQARIMVGAALANVLLDPLLIFGLGALPGLGIGGAALATVIARAATLVAGYHALRRKHALLSFERPSAAELRASWRQVLHVGLPAAGTNMIIPLAHALVVAILAGFGAATVAGYGAAARIEGVTLVPFYALSAVIGPFVGQNLGAGRERRVRRAVRLCARFCLLAGVAMAVLLALLAPWLARLFASDPAVVATTVSYLRWVPLSYGAAGLVMVVNATFNGLGEPLPAVAVSAGRMLALYVPGAWAGALLAGPPGAFAAAALANLAAGAGALWWFNRRHPRGGRRPG